MGELKIKIVLLSTLMGHGGTEAQVEFLAKHLLASRHQVTLVTSGGHRAEALAQAGVEVIYEDSISESPLRMLHVMRLVRHWISKEGADLLCAHSFQTGMGAALAVLGRSNPPPVVLVLHNPFKSWNFRVIAWSGRRWFDQVVCVSESNRDLLLDLGAPADKVISIPNGVDTERYTPHANERLPGPLRVGIVARIEVYKSHDILIEAARKLILEGVQLEVHLCGSGSYEEKLRHKVKAYGMDSHVRFLGMREDVHDVLRNLDVFALPSLVDAFPLALLEAMAAALPVVAARTGDIPRIIEHGVTGLLVEPGNSNDLAAALRRLADSPKLRNQFGERARQKAIKRYSLDDNLTCYEELFLSLIKIQTQRKNDEEIGDNHSA